MCNFTISTRRDKIGDTFVFCFDGFHLEACYLSVQLNEYKAVITPNVIRDLHP
eukprot:m.15417 g.15417  ORF g.15417 m.15417 type:complete len:53 (-) comp5389_c0_seq1:15-173(-)